MPGTDYFGETGLKQNITYLSTPGGNHTIVSVTAVKSIVYSFRSTRETLDTALFTIRKFVFTVTLIHESS